MLLFNGNSTYKVGSFYTTRALYSTTTGTDMTIYETSMTDQDLARRYGTTPRIVSETPVAVGEQVGVTSGYWKRTWDCTMTANVDKLKEGDWTWNGAYRMEGPDCLTRSGSSGSPVLNSQGQIVAVNNTANFNGYWCSDVNACEVSVDLTTGERDTTVVKGARYATRVDQIAGCFTRGRVDLGKAECELYGGAGHMGHGADYWR